MESYRIVEIQIDTAGQLHVFPSSRTFPYVYREAMEIHWDTELGSLHSPVPRGWSYGRWFQQILAAARAQGCELSLTGDTRWLNIDPQTKAELLHVAGSEA